MGLQKYIAQETALHVSDPLYTYVPLALPISDPSATHRHYGFSNLAVKMLLFSTAIHLRSEDVVTNQAEAKTSLRCTTPYQHILDKCSKRTDTCTPSIPLYLIRWFASIFEAISVWRSPAYLCSRFNLPLDPEWKELEFVGGRVIYCGVWEDWRQGVLPEIHVPVLLFVSDTNLPQAYSHFPDTTLLVTFWHRKKQFHIIVSRCLRPTISDFNERRIEAFARAHGGAVLTGPTSTPPKPSPSQVQLICKNLTQFMHVHLANKHIGAWADIHDRRIPYLPYNTHKVLSCIRYKSSIGPWFSSVPPPHFVVYAIMHISLQCVYIGHTAQALISRLRKHMTDALAMVDCSHFHHMLRCTVLADWFIVPLEFQSTETAACVRERHWWFVFRARVLNDVPPAIPQGEGEKHKGSRNRKLVLGLRDLSVARVAQDWAAVKAIKGWVSALGREAGIPIVQIPPIVV